MTYLKCGLVVSAFVASMAFTSAARAEEEGGGGEEECTCEPAPTKANNGFGNGDQTAPGKSLTNNKAENQLGAPGHPSGKPQNPDEPL